MLSTLGYRTEVGGTDFLSADGREAYEIKLGGRGVRDLRDVAMRLATYCARHPRVERGYLLTTLIRVSASRVRHEWAAIKEVLLPDLSARLHLIAMVEGEEITDSIPFARTPIIDQFLQYAKDAVGTPDSRSASIASAKIQSLLGASWKHLEIEKVLLYRWLLGQPPIPIGMLGQMVGCSAPTTLQAIKRLTADGVIERERGRSVALSRYPRERWAELMRAQRLIYPPEEFVDPTTTAGAVDGLISRLNRIQAERPAIGGVVAARRWDPSFDLNGTPRIDLLFHTRVPQALYADQWDRQASEFVRRLDPALQRRSSTVQGATVLALHRTFRHDSLFLNDSQLPIPLADPVSVLVHLNELGLTAQAGQMIRHLRENVRS